MSFSAESGESEYSLRMHDFTWSWVNPQSSICRGTIWGSCKLREVYGRDVTITVDCGKSSPTINLYRRDCFSLWLEDSSSHPSKIKMAFLPLLSSSCFSIALLCSLLPRGRASDIFCKFCGSSRNEIRMTTVNSSKSNPAAQSFEIFHDRVVFPIPGAPSIKIFIPFWSGGIESFDEALITLDTWVHWGTSDSSWSDVLLFSRAVSTFWLWSFITSLRKFTLCRNSGCFRTSFTCSWSGNPFPSSSGILSRFFSTSGVDKFIILIRCCIYTWFSCFNSSSFTWNNESGFKMWHSSILYFLQQRSSIVPCNVAFSNSFNELLLSIFLCPTRARLM